VKRATGQAPVVNSVFQEKVLPKSGGSLEDTLAESLPKNGLIAVIVTLFSGKAYHPRKKTFTAYLNNALIRLINRWPISHVRRT
jgi:hypothetical protein